MYLLEISYLRQSFMDSSTIRIYQQLKETVCFAKASKPSVIYLLGLLDYSLIHLYSRTISRSKANQVVPGANTMASIQVNYWEMPLSLGQQVKQTMCGFWVWMKHYTQISHTKCSSEVCAQFKLYFQPRPASMRQCGWWQFKSCQTFLNPCLPQRRAL